MTLREQIAKDNSALFFNADEFGETRCFNGLIITVIEDNEQLLKYRQAGICEGQKLIYMRRDDLTELPVAEDVVLYGEGTQQRWMVESCREDLGIVELILTRYII